MWIGQFQLVVVISYDNCNWLTEAKNQLSILWKLYILFLLSYYPEFDFRAAIVTIRIGNVIITNVFSSYVYYRNTIMRKYCFWGLQNWIMNYLTNYSIYSLQLCKLRSHIFPYSTKIPMRQKGIQLIPCKNKDEDYDGNEHKLRKKLLYEVIKITTYTGESYW